MIRGRTPASQRDLDLFLIVSVTEGVFSPQVPDREYTNILDLCRQPLSIAEVAAYSKLPMAVAKVIISDLLDNGYPVDVSGAPQRDRKLLMLVLEGLKRLQAEPLVLATKDGGGFSLDFISVLNDFSPNRFEMLEYVRADEHVRHQQRRRGAKHQCSPGEAGHPGHALGLDGWPRLRTGPGHLR